MSVNPFEDFNRWRAEEPLEYPEAVVKLIDALVDYLRADSAFANELLQDDTITLAQYNEGMAGLEDIRALLRKLQLYNTCWDLYGIIKVQR